MEARPKPTNHSKSRKDATGKAARQLPEVPALGMSADALAKDIFHYYRHSFRQRTVNTDTPFVYQATALAVRDRLN